MAKQIVPLQPTQDHARADIRGEEPTQEPFSGRNCSAWQKTHVGAVWEGLYPFGGTPGMLEQGNSGTDKALWTDCNPHSPALFAPWGRGGQRVGNGGVKLNLARRWSGGKVFLLLFLFLPILLYF